MSFEKFKRVGRNARLVSIFALVGGCAVTPQSPPITLPQAESACYSAAFSRLGRCIEARFDTAYPEWRMNTEADLAQAYLSWLNAAGARVESGEMTEDEGLAGAAEMRTRIYKIRAERPVAAPPPPPARREFDISAMLMGLALIEMSRSQSYSIPQPAMAPPITCRTYPVNPITGQIQTVCQ